MGAGTCSTVATVAEEGLAMTARTTAREKSRWQIFAQPYRVWPDCFYFNIKGFLKI